MPTNDPSAGKTQGFRLERMARTLTDPAYTEVKDDPAFHKLVKAYVAASPQQQEVMLRVLQEQARKVRNAEERQP